MAAFDQGTGDRWQLGDIFQVSRSELHSEIIRAQADMVGADKLEQELDIADHFGDISLVEEYHSQHAAIASQCLQAWAVTLQVEAWVGRIGDGATERN